MDIFEHRYYKINKILMSSIGQWPYQTRFVSRSCVSILLFFYVTQVGPQIMAIAEYSNDPEIILESISPFIIDLVCLTKLINCIINSKKMSKLINHIDNDWKVWARDREIKILHKYAETGRKMTIMYTVSIYSTSILFITQPILPKIIDVLFHNGTEPGEFPFPVYYHRLDQQKYYFYIIGATYVCVLAIIGIAVAGDTMFMVYVQHGCGIFAALGHKLERLGENEISADGSDIDYKCLATCIDRHNDAIEFAKLIEAAYSGGFFFLVGFNMIIMSVTGLQIITRTNEPQDTIRFIAFVGAQMIHLYIESYFSQILMDHSTSIRDYIHSAKWYNISLKSQKVLNLISMRCDISCKLTAGKICVMSVETFGAVIKTSMSYFTILRSMQ